MRLVRCVQCGEVADLAKVRTCMGCDHPLPGAPSARPPRRIPDAQRDAGADLGGSKAVLTGLAVAGAISLTLMFLSDGKALAAPLGILAVILFVMVVKPKPKPKKDGEAAPPSVAAQAKRRRNSLIEKALETILLVAGILAALVVGGIAIIFIVCYASFAF